MGVHHPLRVPDALQRVTLQRRAGTVPDIEFSTIPGLQRITFALP
jgi:hypothetical protein